MTKLNCLTSDDVAHVETVEAAERVAGVVLGQLDDAIANSGGRAG